MAVNTGSKVLNKIAGRTVTPSGNKSTARSIDPLDSSANLSDGKEISIRDAITSFVRYDLQEKSAKDLKNEYAEVLKEYTKELRDDYAENGDYQKTFRLLGTKTKSVQHCVDLSQNDKASMPKKEEDIEKLKEILDDKFSEFAERDIQISIRKEVLNNRKLRTELSKKLSEAFGDELKNFFVKEEIWIPKKGIDQRQYELDKDTRNQMREVLKLSSDSIKNTSFKA